MIAIADRPNIIILMTDQHRADCLSCAGHPHVQALNLDRLASGGTRFSNAYSNSPVCMPGPGAQENLVGQDTTAPVIDDLRDRTLNWLLSTDLRIPKTG